jgi:hypothetical protein
VCFGALVACAFLVIPFAYFFVEAGGADEDDATCCQRTWTSVKSTSLLIVVLVVITFVGVVRVDCRTHTRALRAERWPQMFVPGTAPESLKDSSDLMKWLGDLLNVHEGATGARALLLLISVLTAFGAVNSALYTVRSLHAARARRRVRGAGIRAGRTAHGHDPRRQSVAAGAREGAVALRECARVCTKRRRNAAG